MIENSAIREIKTVVILGAGNVAWHLGQCLFKNGIRITEVYNRNEAAGKQLAASVGAGYTSNPKRINRQADLYIIAISDDSISRVADTVGLIDEGILAHTAGGMGIDLLSGKAKNFGILYPLQTFSRNKPVDFSEIPVLIEANNQETLIRIKKLASRLSQHVYEVDSGERMILHLAAVIGSNFTNHLLTLSERLLKERNLSFDLLRPLMVETISKAFTVTPSKSQTGPAIRGNLKVIEAHLRLLEQHPEIRNIYKVISESIMDGNLDLPETEL